MSIEAMKLALEALEEFNFPPHHRSHKAITALRQAIKESSDYVLREQAQAEANERSEVEPVAWMRKDETCTDCFVWEKTEDHTIPLYTSPPQRPVAEPHKPLTDEQIDNAIDAWFDCEGKTWRVRMRAAIKAANGIKGDA